MTDFQIRDTETERNRLALVGPSLLSVHLSEGRKIGWFHPSFTNWLHPHPEMFWIGTNATKTQTHISVYCSLFICSEYNKRTLFLCCTVFVTEWLSCSSDAVPTVWSILKKLTQDGETRVSKYKTSKSWNVVTSKNDDHQHLISVKWQHESSSACCRCGSSNNPPAGGAASPRQHPSRHLHYQQRVTKRTIQTVKNAERRIVWVWTDSILLCHIQFIFCLFLFLLRWNSSILTK